MDIMQMLDKKSMDEVPPIYPSEGENRQHFAQGIDITSIANFRDFGGKPIANSTAVIKPFMLFRCGAPTWASVKDNKYLVNQLNIRTLVDFRTTFETKTLSINDRFEDNFTSYSIKETVAPTTGDNDSLINVADEVDNIDPRKEEVLMEEQKMGKWTKFRRASSSAGGVDKFISQQISSLASAPQPGVRRGSFSVPMPDRARRHYNIPLINNNYFFEGVYESAPPSVKMQCSVVKWALWNEKAGILFLLKHLNDLGLFEMYRLTLEHTKRELLTIMRILKNAENYPIMIFCSLGKDRTGMVSALVLSCLGVPRDVILADYHLSEDNLRPSLDKLRRYFSRIGLSKEEFVLAPSEIMARLLAYLDTTYGSVANYLVDIGFTLEEQDQLRHTLIMQQPQHANDHRSASPANM